MNKQLRVYARKQLKEDLTILGLFNPKCLLLFRQMYSHLNLERPIADVVDSLSDEQLDWAMTQAKNTLVAHSLAATD